MWRQRQTNGPDAGSGNWHALYRVTRVKVLSQPKPFIPGDAQGGQLPRIHGCAVCIDREHGLTILLVYDLEYMPGSFLQPGSGCRIEMPYIQTRAQGILLVIGHVNRMRLAKNQALDIFVLCQHHDAGGIPGIRQGGRQCLLL